MESSQHNWANISETICPELLIFGEQASWTLFFQNSLTNPIISQISFSMTSHFGTLFLTTSLVIQIYDLEHDSRCERHTVFALKCFRRHMLLEICSKCEILLKCCPKCEKVLKGAQNAKQCSKLKKVLKRCSAQSGKAYSSWNHLKLCRSHH